MSDARLGEEGVSRSQDESAQSKTLNDAQYVTTMVGLLPIPTLSPSRQTLLVACHASYGKSPGWCFGTLFRV
jgi:hypothetical protein